MTEKIAVARIAPEGSMEVLSKREVRQLCDSGHGGLHELFRQCVLAVLNCGSETDDAKELLEEFKDFDVLIEQQERGIKLEIHNSPASAFVDGEMIRGIREHVFAVVRDIVYLRNEIEQNEEFGHLTSDGISDVVFHILRNAKVLMPQREPNLVVCWGGHSIGRYEYDYTKEVGYQLGLRGVDICTGCGPGAMKGPMKGATIGHAKQRHYRGRYVGLSEPGIIASEPPNPLVNELVIMPDIEKRLEAFVRIGHGFVVFPGGVGTAEEILYLLGILLHPENRHVSFPLIFTGPKESADYFGRINEFIGAILGPPAQKLYRIKIDDAVGVGKEIKKSMEDVREFRKLTKDAYFFNWYLRIEQDFQTRFEPTHENMASLDLHPDQPPHLLAANLRRAFSGIVAGNVKEKGIRSIEEHGPFEIRGHPAIMNPLEKLLAAFVAQKRMKLPGRVYQPCYRVVS